MEGFKALLVEQEAGKVRSRFTQFSVDALDAGEVLIRVAYSGINYKDALAATGAGKIIRRFPCIAGIDLAGYVEHSASPRFRPGDAVIATSFDIGVSHHGGYAEYARIPAGWVVPLPRGMELLQSMALGTAGFTAALAVERMEQVGLQPDKGPVIVSGATGGVGSIAVDMLASRGYHVVALTGKAQESAYLEMLGAAEIKLRSSIDLSRVRPLESATWAGAVDNVGGEILAWMAATMKQAGTIASIGLAASHELHTTVMPFILRGVSLLGVDSGYWPMPARQRLWERMAADLRPRHLDDITRVIEFDALPGVFQEYLDGKVRGRTVVRMAA